MESEKVKEIKKALKYCCGECDCDCPFYKNGKSYEECKSLLLFEALTLINELESENEELKQDLKKAIDMQNEFVQNLETATKEVELNLAREIPNLLKQFAERLKGKFEHCVGDVYFADTIDERIDETLKEFIK